MRCSEYTNIFRHKIYLDVTEFNIRNQNYVIRTRKENGKKNKNTQIQIGKK